MNESESTERPTTAEGDDLDAERLPAPEEGVEVTTPRTDTDEFAAIEERAEAGDEAAATALEEAGEAEPGPGEAPEEVILQLEKEAVEAPSGDDVDDITDVPTEEATVFEADAERDLAADIIEGEDVGPEVAVGPDTYVRAEEETIDEDLEAAPGRVKPLQEEALEAEPAQSEVPERE